MKCMNCKTEIDCSKPGAQKKKYCSRRCLKSYRRKVKIKETPTLRIKKDRYYKKWYEENREYKCKHSAIMGKLYSDIMALMTQAMYEIEIEKKKK